tara:strand:- start:1019 stop:1504 length:486 start_codon:yes stop_codon:yes gene_type:complete
MIKYQEYLIGNRFVKVLVTKPEDNFRTLTPVRSLIHIPLEYKVKPSEILSVMGEPEYLLAHHHYANGHRVFLGLSINCSVKHSTTLTVKNMITGLPSNRTSYQETVLPCVQDVISHGEEDNLSFEKSIFYLGKSVTTSDKINNHRVRAVTLLGGVYRAEVY